MPTRPALLARAMFVRFRILCLDALALLGAVAALVPLLARRPARRRAVPVPARAAPLERASPS